MVSRLMRPAFDRVDAALLGAYLLMAALGTFNLGLLLNDGAVLLSAGWFGNPWNLYFDQIPGRAVSTILSFGPAWAARSAFGMSSDAYMVLAHLLWFATPLCFWLAVRAVERERFFSRLYLAFTLALAYFPSELIVGIGLWTVWAAIVADDARSARDATIWTVLLAIPLALTHPVTGLMSVLYAAAGVSLIAMRRPFPRRTVAAAIAMAMIVLSAYFAIGALYPTTNPTIANALAANRYDYIDPWWMLATLAFFPMLAALWLLMLAPGINVMAVRWRISPATLAVITVFGLWFAAAGTGLLTWLSSRHSGVHVLVLALALALAAPPVRWVAEARRPLFSYAAIAAVAALSYNVDLYLFGRFVDRHLQPGIVDVATLPDPWPPPLAGRGGARTYFKWGASSDYVRDVVVPEYDWYRLTLAYYSYFRSDRQRVLYHALQRPEDWIPYECAAVDRIVPRDDRDRAFVSFLAERYCVR